VVLGNALQDGLEGTKPKRGVSGNNFVMLSVPQGGDTDVGSFLAGFLVTQAAQGADQVVAGRIAGQLHRAKTTSRTRCKRTTLGAAAGSSK